MNSKTDLDYWGKRSKDFLLPFFRDAKVIVKIASGFFTVQGFNIIANSLEGTTTFILVGYDDTQNKNLVGKLLADVREDLKRWEHYNRRQVVQLLLAKLSKQEIYFRENDDDPYADARIRKNDHGKVYIIDDKIVFSGSVNTTMKGLVYNEEASGGITEPKRVARWVQWFDEKWNAPDTKDLTQLLLALCRGGGCQPIRTSDCRLHLSVASSMALCGHPVWCWPT
jgi:phosphatidylserine/phosphatidylglycerophosphate/cardiolipin synthase-like enzyme